LRRSLFAILVNRADELAPRMSGLIVGLYEDWLWFEERIETLTNEIEQISHREVNCKRLMSAPGHWAGHLHGHGSCHRQLDHARVGLATKQISPALLELS